MVKIGKNKHKFVQKVAKEDVCKSFMKTLKEDLGNKKYPQNLENLENLH
jgi:hypothetical protein